MEQETLANEPNTTLEDDATVLKIKAVNTKTIISALILTLVIAIVSTINSPFSDPFFGMSGIIIHLVLVTFISFAFLYQILFYLFGKTLVAEAKKRGLFLIKNEIPKGFSSFSDHHARSTDDRPINPSHPSHPLSHHYRD